MVLRGRRTSVTVWLRVKSFDNGQFPRTLKLRRRNRSARWAARKNLHGMTALGSIAAATYDLEPYDAVVISNIGHPLCKGIPDRFCAKLRSMYGGSLNPLVAFREYSICIE